MVTLNDGLLRRRAGLDTAGFPVRVAYRHIRPVTVIYVRGSGPYATATVDAWRKLNDWLAAHDARRQVKRAFGVFLDNPQTTPDELMRYDACVQMSPGWVADQDGCIGRQTLGGGTFAVHTHVGSYDALGELFSDLHRAFVPRQGLSVDYDRAFMAIHLNDPRVTREMHRRTEVCVPVMPLPLALTAEADGQDDLAATGLRAAG
jgi:AraC family transcriptional regulator